MKCPKCGYVTFDDLDQCKRCGADWVSKRARFGVQPPLVPASGGIRRSSGTLPAPAADAPVGSSSSEHRLDEEFDRLYARLKEDEEKAEEVLWGGFYRRGCAFSIDVAILIVLSFSLFYFTYVAYTVGLAAHGQMLTLDTLGPYLRILVVMGISLAGGYFVLLHGMDGRTVGKWLLGLRVVAANRTPITYTQALMRLLGAIPSAVFGLGFFWILLSREKRGWHDLLARTWVIRDLGSATSNKN